MKTATSACPGSGRTVYGGNACPVCGRPVQLLRTMAMGPGAKRVPRHNVARPLPGA